MDEDHMDEFDLKRSVEAACKNLAMFSQIHDRMAHKYNGHLFVSHTSTDHGTIADRVMPVVDLATSGRYFIASNRSGTTYNMMVSGALRGSKTILIVGSEAAARSIWVRAECLWAVEQQHPIIFCSLDGTVPSALNPTLTSHLWTLFPRNVATLTYRGSKLSQVKLDRLLRSKRFAPGPWRSLPLGEPPVSGTEMLGCLQSGEDVWELLSRSQRWGG
jgi:hypothetical protein